MRRQLIQNIQSKSIINRRLLTLKNKYWDAYLIDSWKSLLFKMRKPGKMNYHQDLQTEHVKIVYKSNNKLNKEKKRLKLPKKEGQ